MESIHGAPSFRLTSDSVDLCVTRTAGMLAPVTFRIGERVVSPYALAPWQPDEIDPGLPNLLKYLRGDFFCFPFGPQDEGPPHGDTANSEWSLVSESEKSLHLAIHPGDVGGKVEKLVSLKSGHTAVYSEHRISGVEGPFSYGTHPILDCSHLSPREGRITTSPIRFGSVNPGLFSDPANKEYQVLKPGARFLDLRKVPLATGGTTDLTRYPDRKGYEDLIMVANRPATNEQPFAWTAAVLDGYVWFCLKNPAHFPATLFWMSNGGRHSAPWNGRHLARLGLEEVCSHFADNVTTSREHPLADLEIPTVRDFDREQTTCLKIVQAVAAAPENFGAVTSIAPEGEQGVILTSDNNKSVRTPVAWKFAV